ncbi:CubicO group peptidase, beta-lactamase class C family [Dyella sp. OK004]|uniref:serine hydrolase n=1 Tax=Dyella sp. OK004 TaxID=1855292 RepID=UPI0008E1F83B|nr:serine hydrolase [Dyella sp. OK004]SFS17848.1 CubicO group peptidase, beta-lactamase class C family [Dyella sp. OK004]
MRRSLASVVVGAACLLTVSGLIARDVVPVPDELDRMVQKEGEAFIKAGGADGLSIAVVRDGKARFFNFGTKVHGKAQPPDKNTVYEIGSISKTFTSLLLAHALIEKKAAASDDMRRYLPGSYPNLEYQGTPVTLQNLAATTSALPDNLPDLNAVFKNADPKKALPIAAGMLERYSNQAFFEDLHKASLIDKPGTAPRHSNVAAALLGNIVEKIYGKPYDDLLAQYIEKPLGMQSGVSKARLSQAPTGYTGDGSVAPAFNAPYLRAAGGLRYSSADMARYITAQLDATDLAIKLTQQPVWGDVDSQAIGFNWVLAKTVDSQRHLSHSGGTFGFASFMDLYPDAHYGIVFLVNRSGPMTQGQLQTMSERIQQDVFGEPAAVTALGQALKQGGYKDVDATVKHVRQTHPELHLSEAYVNAWGYRLLQGGRANDAVGVLEYNTVHYPKSWNAYDSFAEGLEATGDIKRSIANYRRSLELNPENAHGKERLAKLEKPGESGK